MRLSAVFRGNAIAFQASFTARRSPRNASGAHAIGATRTLTRKPWAKPDGFALNLAGSCARIGRSRPDGCHRIRHKILVAYRATRYHGDMIVSFRHKGLRKYFESGSLAGIQPAHANRLKMQLAALDTAQTIEDMDIPCFRLHPLRGSGNRRWSITVNGNWRITFEFENGNALVLDYEDYH